MPPERYDEEEQYISGMIGLGNEGFGKEKIREREMKKLLGEDKTKKR